MHFLFRQKVWISFTLAFALVVCLSLLSERLWKTRLRLSRSSKIKFRKKLASEIKVARTIFSFFGTLMFQSIPFTNPDDSWRIVLGTWSFSIMVVMTLFSGQLTAAMTVSNQFVVIDSLKDILKNKDLRPVIMAATSFEYFFRDAEPGSEPRLIHEQADRLGGLVPFRDHANYIDMDQMFNRKAVIIGPPFALKAKIGSFCREPPEKEVHFSRHHYFERMMTMNFRLDIPQHMAENINIRMQRYMDAGHVLKFVQSMERNASRCAWTEPIRDPERTLNVKNVSGPFLLWIFGISISFAVLIMEIIIKVIHLQSGKLSKNSLAYFVSRRSNDSGRLSKTSLTFSESRISNGSRRKRTPVLFANLKRPIIFHC